MPDNKGAYQARVAEEDIRKLARNALASSLAAENPETWERRKSRRSAFPLPAGIHPDEARTAMERLLSNKQSSDVVSLLANLLGIGRDSKTSRNLKPLLEKAFGKTSLKELDDKEWNILKNVFSSKEANVAEPLGSLRDFLVNTVENASGIKNGPQRENAAHLLDVARERPELASRINNILKDVYMKPADLLIKGRSNDYVNSLHNMPRLSQLINREGVLNTSANDLPAELKTAWATSMHPDMAKFSPIESKAFDLLNSKNQGIPGFSNFEDKFNVKPLSYQEAQDIVRNKGDSSTFRDEREAADYARAMATLRRQSAKEGRLEIVPTIEETRVINPNEYPGQRLAPVDSKMIESQATAQKLRDEAERVEAVRGNRLLDLTKGVTDNDINRLAHENESASTMGSVLKRLDAEAKRREDSPRSFLDSPELVKAMDLANKNYGSFKNEADEEFGQHLKKMHGYFARHGAEKSSGYEKLVEKARKEHAKRLDDRRLALEERAYDRGLQGFTQQGQESNAVYSQLSQMFPQIAAVNEQHRGVHQQQEQALRKREELLRSGETEKMGRLQAHQASTEAEGSFNRSIEQQKLQAQMDAWKERPGGLADQQRQAAMLATVNGSPGMPVPMPSAAYTQPTVYSPATASAALVGATAPYLSNLLGGNNQQQQQQGMQQQQQNAQSQFQAMLQQMSQQAGGRAFARGGHVREAGDREKYLKKMEEQMFYQLAAEKALRESKPVPHMNPHWQGVADIGSALGNASLQSTSGQIKSPLGAFGEGSVKALQRQNDYMKVEDDKDKERFEMQQLLSTLANKMSGDELDTQKLDREYEKMMLEDDRAKEEIALKRYELEQLPERAAQKAELEEKKALDKKHNDPTTRKQVKAYKDVAEENINALADYAMAYALTKNSDASSGFVSQSVANALEKVPLLDALSPWARRPEGELIKKIYNDLKSVEVLRQKSLHSNMQKETRVLPMANETSFMSTNLDAIQKGLDDTSGVTLSSLQHIHEVAPWEMEELGKYYNEKKHIKINEIVNRIKQNGVALGWSDEHTENVIKDALDAWDNGFQKVKKFVD